MIAAIIVSLFGLLAEYCQVFHFDYNSLFIFNIISFVIFYFPLSLSLDDGMPLMLLAVYHFFLLQKTMMAMLDVHAT